MREERREGVIKCGAGVRGRYSLGGGGDIGIEAAIGAHDVTVWASPQTVSNEKYLGQARRCSRQRPDDLNRMREVIPTRKQLPDRAAIPIDTGVVQGSNPYGDRRG